MNLIEVQMDRLVGPTHHFGGLGVGNIASHKHAGHTSNPRAAAIQGLDKMKLVAELGVPQLILPPQRRPDFDFLRRVGFSGNARQLLANAIEAGRDVASAALSSSAMWLANAATVSAGVENRFGHAALTVANLSASLHRAIEADATHRELTNSLPECVSVLKHITGGAAMRDEGAANHMRLGTGRDEPGIHLFVYGDGDPLPQRHWPRQTRAACEAIARQHGLDPADTFFLKQHPDAVDAGAFHNDVVAASHHDMLLHHETAFYQSEAMMDAIERRFTERCGRPLTRAVVSRETLSIEDAVSTYLFNSQIVSTPDRSPVIICPTQVRQHPSTRMIVEGWSQSGGLFGDVRYVDLSQSMSGGGGPACLRLRVPMSEIEISQVPESKRWTPRLDQQLRAAISDSYPTEFRTIDMLDDAFSAKMSSAQSSVEAVLESHRGHA